MPIAGIGFPIPAIYPKIFFSCELGFALINVSQELRKR